MTTRREVITTATCGQFLPDVRYRLQTVFSEPQGRCLEGNGGVNPDSVLGGAAFMDTCQDVTGQLWIITPN